MQNVTMLEIMVNKIIVMNSIKKMYIKLFVYKYERNFI